MDVSLDRSHRGAVITIVGNSGAGKTTLVRALSALHPFHASMEQHAERPFQAAMKADPRRFGLANQVDYLLYRAEQEQQLRAVKGIGLVDGGLDLDYYGFTQLFHDRGYLSDTEFALCTRLYGHLRAQLGPPDLIVRLTAPLPVIEARYRQRGRALEIAQRDDIALLGRFVDAWLDGLATETCLSYDTAAAGAMSTEQLRLLLDRILDCLAV